MYIMNEYFNFIYETQFKEYLISSIKLNEIHKKLFFRYIHPKKMKKMKIERAEHCFLKYNNYDIGYLSKLFDVTLNKQYYINLITMKRFLHKPFCCMNKKQLMIMLHEI